MEKWTLPDRGSQNRALLRIARFLNTVPDTSYDVEIEIDGPRVIPCANLTSALADPQARNVVLILGPTNNGRPVGDWQLQICGVRDARTAEVEVCAYHQVPQDLRDGVAQVLHPYCATPKKRFRRLRRLGSRIHPHVWTKFVLPVMVIVAATGLMAWMGWKG
ncbi:hypothetical protein [Nonomuraea sp. NPDC050786]|uniref:hypothetical protein n=1 Tax=Nonomuraea sp. NPDC050786 TaxID=3154840 RepID=UPI0033D7631E